MPLLLLSHPAPGATFALWQIVESEDFFRDNIPLTADEAADLAPLNGLRRLEWLASRWLLHRITESPERIPLAKDAFSKPFFMKNPGWHCSLSHSHGIVGALLAQQNCGCDIQVRVDKMARLAHKFLNAKEQTIIETHPPDDRLDMQHIVWTAKETLYKAYGLKALDFRKHLHLEDFTWSQNVGTARGLIQKNGLIQAYHLQFEKMEIPNDQSLIWTIGLPE